MGGERFVGSFDVALQDMMLADGPIIRTTKRAMQAQGASSRPGSRNSNKSEGKAPGINIKQKMVLSLEQQKVLSLVVQEGKNIFFTGSAGKCLSSHSDHDHISSSTLQVPENPFYCERSSNHCERNMLPPQTLSL